MKKAKVVITNAAKKNRWTAKKTVLAAFCAVAALGAVSVVVPTSNIPGFKYIATLIGLNEDATRNLTMADFASYALGTKDNKIQELRASNLSYNGAGNYGGGLSPFATLSADRLAQAYEKNSQEAMEMEKALGGKIAPFDKNILDKDFAIDPNILGKGFDPTKLTGSSKAAYSGAMEALATAAGQQAEAFGKPVKKEDLQNVANLVGLKDANISNIVGTGNILSLAKKDDLLYDRIMKNAKALSATSIFGSVNPEFNRTDTRIGRPVYGLFKDLGTAFFFSRYAVAAKMPTAAADIAIAAFDGGSPQDQSIITSEETQEEPSVSVDPEFELSFGAQSVDSCQQVQEAYKASLAGFYSAIQGIRESMKSLASNRPRTPGMCFGKNSNAVVKAQREAWNNLLPDLEDLCESVREQRIMFASQCGITFEEPIKDCDDMADSLKLASVDKAGVMYIKCRDISVFDKTGVVKFTSKGKSKLRRWERKFKRYKKDYEKQGYTESAAEELAAMDADNDVPIDIEDISDGDYVCRTEPECYEQYFDKRIEEGFAFGDIVDITSLPKKQQR